jgi:hypothetical protein
MAQNDTERYYVRGSVRGSFKRDKSGKKLESMKNTFVGLELDKIELECDFQCDGDITHLIEFLESCRGCFGHHPLDPKK